MGDNPKSAPPERGSRLPDADLVSLHDEGVTGRLTFEARPSWSGGVIDDEQADPLVGTTLHDTYRVSQVIGEGGMGRVYLAQHTRIASKRYALKVLHPEFARNPEIRRRFQHEAEAAAKIEHPGVVGTYDIGETPNGGPYMVCEYLAGEDLNDYLIERGALPAPTVVHIGQQLCSALAAAHARGVIHRDLKPHNVFVMEGTSPRSGSSARIDSPDLPTVKVLDFGLSRFIERDNDLTKTGIILGTPGYMAPEQAAGNATDLRTDIYGIGALLYALSTGRPPFKEDSPQKTVLSVLSQVPARPRDLVQTIPLDLEIFIQRAMARSPDERYQSADQAGLALRRLASAPISGESNPSSAGLDEVSAPRVQLVLLLVAGLVLTAPSLALGLLALLEIRGVVYHDFRPSMLEGLLLTILLLVLVFPLGLFVRRFKKNVWRDSARVADLVPRVRRPLVAATLAYGLGALVALSAWGFESLPRGALRVTPETSLLRWYITLPLCAALAASAVVLWSVARKTKSHFVRALVGTGYSAGAAVAGIVLLLSSAFAPPSLLSPQLPAEREPVNDSGAEPAPAQEEQSSSTSPPRVKTPVAPKVAGKTPSVPSDNEVRERAPAGKLATAQSAGPEALEELSREYPQDGKVLKALVLAYASRADSLVRSVETISRLFEIEASFTKDTEVLFILKKGLLAQGQVHAKAYEVVETRMKEEGGELLFTLLNENPKQHNRLKMAFLELRKANQVSPATAIAYDLRYESSCKGRVAHLPRAEKDGDMRSVQQLQALSTAPKKCGWGKKCQPLCPVEEKQFQKSIAVILERLDGR